MKHQCLFCRENKKMSSVCHLLSSPERVKFEREISKNILKYLLKFLPIMQNINMNLIDATYIRASKLSSHAS